MIIDRANVVAQQLQRFGELRKDQQLAEKLDARAAELKSAVAAITVPVGQATLLVQRGLLRESERPSKEVARVTAAIAKVREVLAADPKTINDSMNRLTGSLTKLATTLTETAKSIWTHYVEDHKPKVAEADLKRCEQYPSERETVDQIRFRSRIPDSPPPATAEEWQAIETRWEGLRTLIGRLPQTSDHPEVNRFLDAVRKGGAPLSLLTESVRAYLIANGKLDSFRIRPE